MFGTSPRHSVQGVGEWEPGSWVRLERLAIKGVGILKSADPNAALLIYTHKYNTPIFVGVGGGGGGYGVPYTTRPIERSTWSGGEQGVRV